MLFCYWQISKLGSNHSRFLNYFASYEGKFYLS